MQPGSLPDLTLHGWRETRDTLHGYAQLLGKVRRALTPPRKHWWHISLRIAACGLTTTPMPAGDRTVELLLDLANHRLVAASSSGEIWQRPLRGQSPADFYEQTMSVLRELDAEPELDAVAYSAEEPTAYDPAAVERFWRSLTQIGTAFEAFRGRLREETSPVQLFSHHFDLSFSWFSGRLVPGEDPADEESADEQLTFGFATGDEGIAEPYFYVTAYPRPDGWVGSPLPEDARWQEEGFVGAVLPYAALSRSAAPAALLDEYLSSAHRRARELMSGEGPGDG